MNISARLFSCSTCRTFTRNHDSISYFLFLISYLSVLLLLPHTWWITLPHLLPSPYFWIWIVILNLPVSQKIKNLLSSWFEKYAIPTHVCFWKNFFILLRIVLDWNHTGNYLYFLIQEESGRSDVQAGYEIWYLSHFILADSEKEIILFMIWFIQDFNWNSIPDYDFKCY